MMFINNIYIYIYVATFEYFDLRFINFFCFNCFFSLRLLLLFRYFAFFVDFHLI